jgi:hypothetical protein
MRSCTTRTLHVSQAIAIPGCAAQVSVRAGSVVAHLASLNRDGLGQPFVLSAANDIFEPTFPNFCDAAKVRYHGGDKNVQQSLGF